MRFRTQYLSICCCGFSGWQYILLGVRLSVLKFGGSGWSVNAGPLG